MTININQFSQETTIVRGKYDLDIGRTGILAGKISQNQATALNPGDAVKLDTTSGKVPQFVAAGITEDAIGFITYRAQSSLLEAGANVEVLLPSAKVMWMEAGGSISAGAKVESKSDGTIQTLATSKERGIAIDPAISGDLLRVILTRPIE